MKTRKPYYTMDARTYEQTLARLGHIWADLVLPATTAESMLAYAVAPAWRVFAARYAR